MGGFEIRIDDLTGEASQALVALHHRGMLANTPPEHAYVLGVSGLQTADTRVWTAWSDGRVAGIGALRRYANGVAEIKSMRTHPDFLRQGVASLLLDTIIAAARAGGVAKLSLETGYGESFEAALALYRNRGFQNGPVFGEYEPSPYNQFLHLDL